MGRILVFSIMTVAAFSTGCMSFSSTALKRFDDNQFVGESNGHSGLHHSARPFKGVPITLRVPSHLDVYIDETYFVKLDAVSAREPLSGQVRLMSVRTEVIKTDKVFTVDFKRPGAGTLDVKMTFDEEEQYFKKIISSLEDTTITDTAELASTVIKRFSALSASTGRSESSDVATVRDALKNADIDRDTRVVAYKRFDINSSTFEQDVECFVNEHLNDCSRCNQKPLYDDRQAFMNAH